MSKCIHIGGIEPMKSQFTPGPWLASQSAVYRTVKTPDGRLICFAGMMENAATAALIAAAPDLFAALESILQSAKPMDFGLHVVSSESIAAGRAAIEKARGEV
jgi:hypothetical protein